MNYLEHSYGKTDVENSPSIDDLPMQHDHYITKEANLTALGRGKVVVIGFGGDYHMAISTGKYHISPF